MTSRGLIAVWSCLTSGLWAAGAPGRTQPPSPNLTLTAVQGLNASGAPVEEGHVGAGAGATIGKFFGHTGAMKTRIGSSAIELPNGLVVAAIVAVNAMGDIVDPQTGQVSNRGRPDANRSLRPGW